MNDMSAILVDELSKNYGSVRALDNINFKVQEGSIFGFLGPNGAGKSTTIGLLLQFLKPDHGEIRIFDEDITNNTSIKRRIAVIPDADLPKISGLQLLRHTARYYGYQGKQLKDRLREIITRIGIRDYVSRSTATLSKGQKTRIKIANALISDPDLIIADEPTSGLDPFARREFLQLMTELVLEEKTIFFSSHVVGEVEKVCNQLIILNQGRVVAGGTLSEISQHLPTSNSYNIWGSGITQHLLNQLTGVTDVTVVSPEHYTVVVEQTESTPRFLKELLDHDSISLFSFNKESMDLEEIFMQTIGGEQL